MSNRWVIVPLLVGLAACGTGSQDALPNFEIKAIGPEGGTIAAGDVTVVFPPGAFNQATQVSILPSRDPLPFAPTPGDPCAYDYLGPIWCVGPVGHNVFVPSTLIVRYAEALIPPGHTESDLVLFAWDNAAGVLRPVPGAMQDVVANHFTLNTYIELGHLAVMVRTCDRRTSAPNFAFAANPAPNPLTVPGDFTAGLFVANSEEDLTVTPPVQVPTNGDVPTTLVPSRDGTHILYLVFGQQTDASDMYAVPVSGGAAPAKIADNIFANTSISGWWGNTGGSSDVFYQFFDSSNLGKIGVGGQTLVEPGRDTEVIGLESRDASTRTIFHGVPNQDSPFITDVRQAPGDGHILVRYTDVPEGSEDNLEAVDASTGAVTEEFLPTGGGLFTPRFNGAGDRVVYVNFNRLSARAVTLDGDTDEEIYTPQQGQEILDFAPAPDGTHFLSIETPIITGGSISHTLVLGRFDGSGAFTVLEAESLGDEFTYTEVVWHPESTHAYMDTRSLSTAVSGVIPVTMDAAAVAPNRIVVHPTIPVSMRQLDVSRADGRLLVTIPPPPSRIQPIVSPGSSQFVSTGIWVSGPDGLNPTLILDNLNQMPVFVPARWLQTFRTTFGDSPAVR